MKRLGLFAIGVLLTVIGFGQQPSFEWAVGEGGSSADQTESVQVGVNGDVFITGQFQGTVDFDPGAGVFNLVSNGGRDIFVQKLDNSGNFIWAKSIGGSSGDYGYSITTDASDNVYVCGFFQSVSVDFDPGPGIQIETLSGASDGFVLALDSNGDFLWSHVTGGAGQECSRSIDYDGLGNIVLSGYFDSTVDFDPGVGTLSLTSNGNYDVFIQKLSITGSLVWVKSVGGTDNDDVKDLEIDASGNVVLCGNFKTTVDFDPSPGVMNFTSLGNDDIFVLNLSSSGNYNWARTFGSSSSLSPDQPFALACDGSGNVFTVGWYNNSIDFDPSAGMSIYTPIGVTDAFVHKFSSTGAFEWVKSFGGVFADGAREIAIDGNNDLYITGSYRSSVDFNPNVGDSTLSAVGGDDIFILKLLNDGSFDFVRAFGGSGYDYGQTIVVDVSGNIFTGGKFQNSVDFNPDAGVNNSTATGSYDIFVQKLSQCTPTAPTPDVINLPNLTDECSVSGPTAPTATSNCLGTITGTTTTSFPITTQGTTTITWTYDDGNGNVVTQDQDVIIDDTTDPVLDAGSLANLTDECSVSTPTAPTATDNCSGTITGTTTTTFPITAQGTTTVAWTFDDGNGNVVTQDQDVIIDDVSDPLPDAGSLPNLMDECLVAAPTAPTATDNCAGTITGTTSTTFPITSQGTTTITWTYDDGNGNVITQDQDVVIADITPPTASNPSAVSVECTADIPAVDITVVTDEADNCVTPTVAHVSDVSDGNTCPEVITRSYSVTDAGSNQITVTQTITVEDVTDPVADVATLTDESFECEANPTPPTATDNCDGTLDGTPDVTFPLATIGTTTVTWTYSDNCGNAITQTQNITVTDIDNSVSVSGITISADAGGYQYQWVDCDNSNAPITGETNQSFTPTSNGNYAVEITDGTCTVTSSCTAVTTIGILEPNNSEVSIYPNPTNGKVTITLYKLETLSYELLSLEGKVISSQNGIYSNQFEIDLSDQANGIYWLKIETQNELKTLKLVKQ